MNTSASEIDVEVKKVALEDMQTPPFKARVDFYLVYYSPADHSEIKRNLYTANFVFVFRSKVLNELIPIQSSRTRNHPISERPGIQMKNRLNKHHLLREKAGWTPVELANSVGVTRATITAIENGSYDPSLFLAYDIAEALTPRVDRAISSSATKSATRTASSKTVVRQAVFRLR